MSSLYLTLYSFGSSITWTGSSSTLELLKTIGNSGPHDLRDVDMRSLWPYIKSGSTTKNVLLIEPEKKQANCTSHPVEDGGLNNICIHF